jgi:hypothetical protein
MGGKTAMKNIHIERRIAALEKAAGSLPQCSRCAAEAAREPLTEAEIDERIRYHIARIEGQIEPDPMMESRFSLPDPSPNCPKCSGCMAEIAALSKDEVDARLAELLPLLKESIRYEPEHH